MGEYETELLGDDDFRNLAETAHILSELEQLGGYITFKELVELDIRKHQHLILAGRADSMESYRFHTGYVAGAMAALKLPERVRAIYQAEIDRRTPEPAEEVEASDDERAYAAF